VIGGMVFDLVCHLPRRVPSMPNDKRARSDDRNLGHIRCPYRPKSGAGADACVTSRIAELIFATRVHSVMLPISLFPLRAHDVHADATSGGGRAMACRPIGLCPPERLERGWSANRGARLTRVSAKRLQRAGGAADVRVPRMSVPATTTPRGTGGRERCSTA
jgi:hypothetical protein